MSIQTYLEKEQSLKIWHKTSSPTRHKIHLGSKLTPIQINDTFKGILSMIHLQPNTLVLKGTKAFQQGVRLCLIESSIGGTTWKKAMPSNQAVKNNHPLYLLTTTTNLHQRQSDRRWQLSHAKSNLASKPGFSSQYRSYLQPNQHRS